MYYKELSIKKENNLSMESLIKLFHQITYKHILIKTVINIIT
jgi:hypothetical protein